MAKWLHDFSAQYAAGIAVVITLAIVAAAIGGVGYWARASNLSGPEIVVIVVGLIAGALIILCALLWLRDRLSGRRGKRSGEQLLEPNVLSRTPFAPYVHLSSKLMHLDFTGLFAQTERYIEAIVYLQHSCTEQITITGVDGHMNIGGEDCSLAARLMNGPREMKSAGSNWDIRIRQPLMPEMAKELMMGLSKMNLYSYAGEVRISIATMKLVGTVHYAEGDKALPQRVVTDEAVLVRGPMREDTADKVTWRVNAQFVSQTYYNLHDGSLREPPPEQRQEVEALQNELIETQQKLVTQQLLTDNAENEVRRRDAQLDGVRKKVDWADDLIERARGVQPISIAAEGAWLARPSDTLNNKEPWFDLCISFVYYGVHRLIVGERLTGSLARWGGEKYNHDPRLSFDWDNAPTESPRV